jgi:hypothetical protein
LCVTWGMWPRSLKYFVQLQHKMAAKNCKCSNKYPACQMIIVCNVGYATKKPKHANPLSNSNIRWLP